MESRSKPGAYFYAHPATKRTQTEHPGEKQISSKRPEGPSRRRKNEAEVEEAGRDVVQKRTSLLLFFWRSLNWKTTIAETLKIGEV